MDSITYRSKVSVWALRLSSSLAILYMGDFEKKSMYLRLQPLIFVRYIDDIFMIWPHTLEELDTFIEHLTWCTESIQITSAVSKTQINFLDIKIKLEEGKLETDLYTKPTDSHDCMSIIWHIPNSAKTASPTASSWESDGYVARSQTLTTV